MNPFFCPGEMGPHKRCCYSFFAAGQDPGGEKWGPNRGQLEAVWAQIDPGKKMGATFDTQWAAEVATHRPVEGTKGAMRPLKKVKKSISNTMF